MTLSNTLTSVAALTLVLWTGPASATTKDAKAVNPHGEFVRFVIMHADPKRGPVNGSFTTFRQVSGKVDLKKLSKSKATFEVDITSVKTGIGKRDGHLKSGDFFDVAKWARATIAVDKVRKTKKGHKARVTLTIRDIKKSFDADFSIVKEIKGGVLIEGKTSLNRRHYNVGAEPAKTGAAEEAKIHVRLAVMSK